MNRRTIVAWSALGVFIIGAGITIAAQLGAFSSSFPQAAQTTTTAAQTGAGLSMLRDLPRGLFGGVSTAAAYLGITTTQLRKDVGHGRTLAQLAKAKGKSASGLTAAIVAKEKKLLARAVSKGRLSQAEAQLLEANIRRIVDQVVHSGIGTSLTG